MTKIAGMNITQRNFLVKKMKEVLEKKKEEVRKLYPKPDKLEFLKDNAPRKTFSTAEIIKVYEEVSVSSSYNHGSAMVEAFFGIEKAYREACEVSSNAKEVAIEKLNDFYDALEEEIVFDTSCADAMATLEKLRTWNP